MATGYTAPIIDGEEEISFNKFAWRIARAFLPHMRDDAMGATIVKPSVGEYHKECLANAIKKLTKADACTADDWSALANSCNLEANELYDKSLIRYKEELRRFNNMLSKVEDWEPPTEEHEGMKVYMQEQLQESIKWVYSPDSVTLVSATSFRDQEYKSIQRNIKYHSEKLEEEVEGVNKTIVWIEALEKSIGKPEKKGT